MEKLSLRNLTKSFDGTVVAVDDLTLSVKEGELVVLLGPSGCGKSTILRLIAGLETPDCGDIILEGRRINDLSPKDRDVAMVFQEYALYPHMTVFDNLAFPLKMRKVRRADINKQVNWTAEILGLGQLLHRKPKALSGGQRQRVALGRAVVRNPRLFLFDEPLSNLDAKLRQQMRGEISRLHRRLKATILYVTHDQQEAMTLGDRVAILREGRLRQVGPPLELYRRPAEVFVGEFIGNPGMNFLPALVEPSGDLVIADLSFPPPKGVRDRLKSYVGEKLLLGIRPEEILTVSTPDAVALVVEIDLVEELGNEIILRAVCGEHRLTARARDIGGLEMGQRVTFFLPWSEIRLFEGRSQRALLQFAG
jgi:multiple sugar transport system ATP-binding protein